MPAVIVHVWWVIRAYDSYW